jgi:hypothetical protein
MGKRITIPENSKFGRWTVSGQSRMNRYLEYFCVCDCGTAKWLVATELRRGKTQSCGCKVTESLVAASRQRRGVASPTYKHGQTKTKEHRTWVGIKRRCYNKSDHKYEIYGARGITMCDRWLESFHNFLDDMGKAPTKAHTIDRVNVNGNYTPDNCRWATTAEQANNKRNTVLIEFDGEILAMTTFCKKYNLRYRTFKDNFRWRKTSLEIAMQKAKVTIVTANLSKLY